MSYKYANHASSKVERMFVILDATYLYARVLIKIDQDTYCALDYRFGKEEVDFTYSAVCQY